MLLDKGRLLDAVKETFKKAALVEKSVEILESECRQRLRENQNMKEQIELLEYRLRSANRKLEDRRKLWVRKKSLENTVNTMKMDNKRLRSDLDEEERKYTDLWRLIERCGLVDTLVPSWNSETFLNDSINEADASVTAHNSRTYAYAATGWDVSHTEDSHFADLQMKQYQPTENWENSEASSTKWKSENEDDVTKSQISSCANNTFTGKGFKEECFDFSRGYAESTEISKHGDSVITVLPRKASLVSTDAETEWWDDVWVEGDQSSVTSSNELKVTPWKEMYTGLPKRDENSVNDESELKVGNVDFKRNAKARETYSSSSSNSRASFVSTATENGFWDDSDEASNESSDIAGQKLKVTLCAEENGLQKQGDDNMSQFESNYDYLPQNGKAHELQSSLNDRTTVVSSEMKCGCWNDSNATQDEIWETSDYKFEFMEGSETDSNSQNQHNDSNFSNCNITSDEDYLKLHNSSNARSHLVVGEVKNGSSDDLSTEKDKTSTVDDQDLNVLQETEVRIEFRKQEENISNLNASDSNITSYEEYLKSHSSLSNCKHQLVTTELNRRPWCCDSSLEKDKSPEVTNLESRCELEVMREPETGSSCSAKRRASHISDRNVSNSRTSNHEVSLKLNSYISNGKLRLATRPQKLSGKNNRSLEVPDEELKVLPDAEKGCCCRKQEQNILNVSHSNIPSYEAYSKLCSSLFGEKADLSSTAKESSKRGDPSEENNENLEVTDQELKIVLAAKIVTDFQNQDARGETNTSDSAVNHSNKTNYEEYSRKLCSSLFTGKSQVVTTAMKSELCDDSGEKNNDVLEVFDQELKASQSDEANRNFQKKKSVAVTELNVGNANIQSNEEHLKLQSFLLLNGNTQSSEDGETESSDLPTVHAFKVRLGTRMDLDDQKVTDGNLFCHSEMNTDDDSGPPHHDIRDIADSTLNEKRFGKVRMTSSSEYLNERVEEEVELQVCNGNTGTAALFRSAVESLLTESPLSACKVSTL